MKTTFLLLIISALLMSTGVASAATREYEGTVVSVNRDNRTFRLHDSERGTVRIKVRRSTRFERINGFSGLRKGQHNIEATVRRVNGRWVALEVERSGGGGEHGGDDGDDDERNSPSSAPGCGAVRRVGSRSIGAGSVPADPPPVRAGFLPAGCVKPASPRWTIKTVPAAIVAARTIRSHQLTVSVPPITWIAASAQNTGMKRCALRQRLAPRRRRA